MNNMHIILLIVATTLTTLVGVAQILVEWKYHDRRTQRSQRIRFSLVIGFILLGLTSIGLALVNANSQKQLSDDLAAMKGILEQQPKFVLYVNQTRVDTNTPYRITQSDGAYPFQITFANIGSKSATDVLIQLVGPVDPNSIHPPWRRYEGAGMGQTLTHHSLPGATYSMPAAVHKDVYIDLPTLSLFPSDNTYVSVAIKCTEKVNSWWDFNVHFD